MNAKVSARALHSWAWVGVVVAMVSLAVNGNMALAARGTAVSPTSSSGSFVAAGLVHMGGAVVPGSFEPGPFEAGAEAVPATYTTVVTCAAVGLLLVPFLFSTIRLLRRSRIT